MALHVASWVEAVLRDNANAVSSQDLGVGVLTAGAGVKARVGLFQLLNEQASLHVEGAVVVALRELRKERQKFSLCCSLYSRRCSRILCALVCSSAFWNNGS